MRFKTAERIELQISETNPMTDPQNAKMWKSGYWAGVKAERKQFNIAEASKNRQIKGLRDALHELVEKVKKKEGNTCTSREMAKAIKALVK